MDHDRRTVLKGSALGLLGVGVGHANGKGVEMPSNREQTVRNSSPSCSTVESKFDSLANTKPYEHSIWGLQVVDLESGETVHARNHDEFFVPGSTAKLMTVSTALDKLGADHRFRTPIYRTGPVTSGRLKGDLVLVGSGDLTMGGRTLPDGKIAYTSVDHTYANAIPGATLTKTNPLAGLDDLAAQVRRSGINRVEGDVQIDTRLFEDHTILDPETPLSPIIINDNLIDVLVSPTEPGRRATVTHRPETAAYEVFSDVVTVVDSKQTNIELSNPQKGDIYVSGQITAGDNSVLHVYQVEDIAAFARTTLIEALERAGVEVAAPPVGPNPVAGLPDTSYSSSTKVAELVSLPFSEYVKLIFKTSHNLGANLLVCLMAVEAGSHNCIDGFGVIHDFLEKIDVETTEVSLSDGRGGAPEDHITPQAIIALLSYWHDTPSAEEFATSLPILGVDGSLAEVATDSPAAGHVFAKTGTIAGPDYLNNSIFLTAQTLGGYIDTPDGRRLAMSLFMNNADVKDIEGIIDVGDQVGELAATIQQEC